MFLTYLERGIAKPKTLTLKKSVTNDILNYCALDVYVF